MSIRIVSVGISLILTAVAACVPEVAIAQYNGNQKSIVAHIEENGNIDVDMPSDMDTRMGYTEVRPEATHTAVSGRMGGYRIQVFSDNNARTAKSEARQRARNISSRFPEYQTYVVYSSPYWRLRVGNFRTMEEANNAADQVKEAFPAYSREIRVVRDRIVVND